MDIYMIAVVLAPYPPAPFPAGENNFSSCGVCGKGENLFLRDWGAKLPSLSSSQPVLLALFEIIFRRENKECRVKMAIWFP